MNGFYKEIYSCVQKIPRGKVASYGTVAAAAGKPRAARTVGWALHVNPDPLVTPCHRVVFRDGSLTHGYAFGGEEVQRALLVAEGVEFDEYGKVKESCFFGFGQ